MVFSYFDESADEKKESHVAVGGVLGHEFLLNLVEGEWIKNTKCLREPFRSTDCECQHGQFKDWPKSKCDDLMRRLVKVLSDDKVGCFAFAVPVPAYREVFQDSNEDDPMRLAVAHTIVEMARLARKHREKIRLWFEDGPYHSLTDKMFRSLKSLESWKWDERGRLVGVSFDDKSLVPLQAADLVAREGFKLAANFGKRNLRKPVLGFWDRMGMGWYTKEVLQMLKENGWPNNFHAIVSLPDTCYLREQKTRGGEYFMTSRD